MDCPPLPVSGSARGELAGPWLHSFSQSFKNIQEQGNVRGKKVKEKCERKKRNEQSLALLVVDTIFRTRVVIQIRKRLDRQR